jgi:hypothetical protein
VNPSQSGLYRAEVSDVSGSLLSSNATLTVTPLAQSGLMSLMWAISPGQRPYVTTDTTQRGLAYNRDTRNLLLVSRADGDAVRVLDGETGADVRTLAMDTNNTVTGGKYIINMVRVNAAGEIFVCNVTTNASVDAFKLYRWFDDSIYSYAYMMWSGKPGGLDDTDRWGDTMDVRDKEGDTQVLVASRSGTNVAIIRVNQGSLWTFAVPDAPPGAFAQGLAWGEGDTFWGKSLGGVLYHVGLDLNTLNANVLHAYSNVTTLGPIGLATELGVMAGVSIETPDNLRLYDMTDLYSGPVNIDTAFYPTDNSNPSGYGAVAFGPNRVYALDSNNGILAMRIRPQLKFSSTSTNVTLRWIGSYVLQSCSTVDGTYHDLPDARSPYPVDTARQGQTFFRLRINDP